MKHIKKFNESNESKYKSYLGLNDEEKEELKKGFPTKRSAEINNLLDDAKNYPSNIINAWIKIIDLLKDASYIDDIGYRHDLNRILFTTKLNDEDGLPQEIRSQIINVQADLKKVSTKIENLYKMLHAGDDTHINRAI